MGKRAVSLALAASMFGLSSGHVTVAQDLRSAGGDPSLAAPSGADFPMADGYLLQLESAGLRAKAAARRLATAANDASTVRLLMDLRRYDDVLGVLRAIVDTRPDEMGAAFEVLGSDTRLMLSDVARDRSGTLRRIVMDARRRLAGLPKEQAATVARALVSVDTELAGSADAWRSQMARFVALYAGTEAARLAEVDLITDRFGPEMLAALDAFVQAHPETNAAAKALYEKAFQLGNNAVPLGERPGDDPTDRFFRVLDIYHQLRSGRYPRSEWVDKAPSLVVEFFTFQPSYAAGNIDRILSAYEDFLPSLLPAFEDDPAKAPIAFVIGFQMGTLFKIKGDAIGGIEGVFDRLALKAGNPDAVRLLKAELFLRPNEPAIDAKDRPAALVKGQASLESLAQQATGVSQRRALAALATLRLSQADYTAARDLYRRYLDVYPGSDYAVAAMLHIGQCEEALGNTAGAADVFRRAAERFAGNPVAIVLGRVYAARLAESTGEYAQALADYESALAAWDADYGPRFSLGGRRATPGGRYIADDVLRDTLPVRISELKRTTGIADGALLERGRWLMMRERWSEAADSFGTFLSEHPASPLAGDARRLSRRARFENALDLADPEKPGGDVAAALATLKALGGEPAGFEAIAAKLARATLMFVQGSPGDADAIMAEALTSWQALDKPKPPSAPAGASQRDAVEIRNAVFRPDGGGVFQGDGWTALNWDRASSRFLLVDAELRVKSPQGDITVVTAYDAFPKFTHVLFVDKERHALLDRIVLRLGRTRPPQPPGVSPDIAAFWTKRFWIQFGYWAGRSFESYPAIGDIEFIDAARTRATVGVGVGAQGATVQMEKRRGVWIAMTLTNFWIA